VFFENIQIQNFMKIRPVGDELFHADGRTGMRKLIAAFRNFSKTPKGTFLYKKASAYRSPYYTSRLWISLSYSLQCLQKRIKERVLKNCKQFLRLKRALRFKYNTANIIYIDIQHR
jgi:hypothetical protein